MRTQSSKPFIILLVLVLLISLACNFEITFGEEEPTATPLPGNTAEPTQTPTSAPQIPPTEEAPPTLPPQAPPTEVPPQAPIPGFNIRASQPGDIYYSERFEGLESWAYLLLSGDENGYSFQAFDNRLRTDIQTQDTWVYYFLEGVEFQDIRIDIQVENRASNTNFVGMICHFSSRGWYEANILNTGEYVIYYYAGEAGSGELNEMFTGGSTLIKTGRTINDYALICQGETLTILINGQEVRSIPLRTGDFPFLDSGQVGLSVSTSYAIPVIVDFLQFVLSVP